MANPRSRLLVSTALMIILVLDAIIQLALEGTAIHWLSYASRTNFTIGSGTTSFEINGTPRYLIISQDQFSIAAAVLIMMIGGLGGAIALSARPNAQMSEVRGYRQRFFRLWLVANALSFLFTTAAFIFAFATVLPQRGQSIDPVVAANNVDEPYPRLYWRAQVWVGALSRLDLRAPSQIDDVQWIHAVMRGTLFNLIPLVLLHVTATLVATLDFRRWKQRASQRTISETPKAASSVGTDAELQLLRHPARLHELSHDESTQMMELSGSYRWNAELESPALRASVENTHG